MKNGDAEIRQRVGEKGNVYIGHDRRFFELASSLKKKEYSHLLRDEPILYRWWFKEDSILMEFLNNYKKENLKDNVCACPSLKTKVIGTSTYYALYIGQSITGKTRFKNHISGPIKNSTLRETIRAILSLMNVTYKKGDITKVLDDAYFEWVEMNEDVELLALIESGAIIASCYPLNIKDNYMICENWKKKILDERKKLKRKRQKQTTNATNKSNTIIY